MVAGVSGCSGEKTSQIPKNTAETQTESQPENTRHAIESQNDAIRSEERVQGASEPVSTELLDMAELQAAGLDALHNGASDEAYDFARRAMRLDDEDPQVIFLMPMVLAERQRFAEAIKMLDDVAATTPQARLPEMGQKHIVSTGNWNVSSLG